MCSWCGNSNILHAQQWCVLTRFLLSKLTSHVKPKSQTTLQYSYHREITFHDDLEHSALNVMPFIQLLHCELIKWILKITACKQMLKIPAYTSQFVDITETTNAVYGSYTWTTWVSRVRFITGRPPSRHREIPRHFPNSSRHSYTSCYPRHAYIYIVTASSTL